jgi:hypothetical protein
LAWRSFGYDRFTQQILCANAVKQTVIAYGTIAELEEWRSINDQQGYRAIINAITNCISIGDITATEADGNVELIEVKSGKTKSRRLTRQKNRLHCYVEYVDVGKLAELELAASSMEPAYHHHIKQWGKGLASRGCSLNIIAFHPNVAPFSIFPSTTALASNLGRRFLPHT